MQFRIQKLDGGVLYHINQHIIKVRSAGRIPLLFFFFFILDLCGMKRIAESFVLCENECLIKPENPHFYYHFLSASVLWCTKTKKDGQKWRKEPFCIPSNKVEKCLYYTIFSTEAFTLSNPTCSSNIYHSTSRNSIFWNTLYTIEPQVKKISWKGSR